ncbi:hypothetical protein FZEAL_1843 [Fusarium zealandicum]|uniref:Uncharacterized protein n=1 Tax=Fusarium zealandicum TaxID=1053134 RepID=A0A8H4XPI1_9HYPO|nr:hypothetical protein FZEAL_1843 [Fusarium zealandicum]
MIHALTLQLPPVASRLRPKLARPLHGSKTTVHVTLPPAQKAGPTEILPARFVLVPAAASLAFFQSLLLLFSTPDARVSSYPPSPPFIQLVRFLIFSHSQRFSAIVSEICHFFSFSIPFPVFPLVITVLATANAAKRRAKGVAPLPPLPSFASLPTVRDTVLSAQVIIRGAATTLEYATSVPASIASSPPHNHSTSSSQAIISALLPSRPLSRRSSGHQFDARRKSSGSRTQPEIRIPSPSIQPAERTVLARHQSLHEYFTEAPFHRSHYTSTFSFENP